MHPINVFWKLFREGKSKKEAKWFVEQERGGSLALPLFIGQGNCLGLWVSSVFGQGVALEIRL